jgi:ATP-dependent Clp protease ATP-binding subunit ClpC
MSEYREQHTVSRLFGAPPGYVGYEQGGQLTEAVRRRPYRVVLFDEIEKAHPEVWNALMQILEDGRMTDGQGRTVDFRNAVIIMTSNLGTEFARKGGALGFIPNGDPELVADHKKIDEALRTNFRPEFLNRIDEIIIFDPLTRDDVKRIVDLQMKDIARRLEEQGLFVSLTEEARNKLAEIGFDPQFGARPLRRALQRHIESPLSVQLLKGDFKPGDLVEVHLTEQAEIGFRQLERGHVPAAAQKAKTPADV